MKRILLAGATLLALATAQPTLAADAPVYKGPAPYAAAALFNWTGFYIGVHAGGAWSANRWSTTTTGLDAGSHSASGWLAGGQVGFNHQVGSWLWGVEAQFSWANLEASNINLQAAAITDNTKTDYLGTIAGRLGVTWDRTLVFVKGGGAWAHDQFWTTSAGCLPTICQSLTETRWGWMVGVGAEYAFAPNWSVKVEYNYLDFGTRSELLAPICLGCTAFSYDVRQTIQLVKVGLNYRFGAM